MSFSIRLVAVNTAGTHFKKINKKMKRTHDDAMEPNPERLDPGTNPFEMIIDDMISEIARLLVDPADYFALAGTNRKTFELLKMPPLYLAMCQAYFHPWRMVLSNEWSLEDSSIIQTPELCLAAVEERGRSLRHVPRQTPELCLVAVEQDGYALRYVYHQTLEICLAAVRQNGSVLYLVEQQTPELCLTAVQNKGHAIQHVHEQTPELCLAAVQQNGSALEFVQLQTPDICLAAVQRDSNALSYVKQQTPELRLAAIQQKRYAQ